ncbi:MAG: hypothetical protein K8S62_06460 [Candidatus Sabulitectum sp.]|nr:hypothetical protein [Candidatus Sabulitectum sp.]
MHRSYYATDIKRLTDPRWKEYRHFYRITGGYLEKVIKERLPGYKELVWKNLYYGRRAKRQIRFEREFSFENPLHAVIPEAFPILKKYVYFPPAVSRYYSEQAQALDET